MNPDEEIVMTPTKKGRTTTIKIEKKKKVEMDPSMVAHQGGGEHKGLVINKQTDTGGEATPPHLQLEFKCFLVDNKTGNHIPESRVLKFWFQQGTDYLDKVTGAYEFFKELVKPAHFPRDYVGFIKKVMKQMQEEKYIQMKKVDVDLMQLDTAEGPPPSPDSKFLAASGMQQTDTRPAHVICQEEVLSTLESAYPNVLVTDDLVKILGTEQVMITEQLNELQSRNLVKEIEPGKWVRKVLDDKTDVKIVKQMTPMVGQAPPTIAIITSKYYEKLAVDAMMEEKTTYMRYKTEGESNVYTIGQIGSHKVVSTKLPAIGRQRAAQISSGSTTTRLMGTFGDVEHVFLVGVAGGVPHYTDFFKHVRLGDVVVSTPNQKGSLYIYCDKVNHKENNAVQYSLKGWAPLDPIMQKISEQVTDEFKADPGSSAYEQYIKEGQELLRGQEADFSRPAPETDRLYMNIGGNDVIEVGHPPVSEEAKHWHKEGIPVIRTGAIGSGKPVIKDDALRLEFASRHNCVAFDTEFDQVLESIVGNRKDSFIFIRGIADYIDGTKNQGWQPYAALSAAAYMKTLINAMTNPKFQQGE